MRPYGSFLKAFRSRLRRRGGLGRRGPALAFRGLGAAAFSLAALFAPPASSETLTVQGSTTFNAALILPYGSAVEAASGHVLKVVPNRSNFGLVALFEGRADLAMISSPLEVETDWLRRQRPDLDAARLRGFEIARTRVAFIVNPGNTARNIKVEDVRRILSGGITNWRELGGPDLPIRVVAARGGGGAVLAVETQLLGGSAIKAADAVRVQNSSLILKVVEQEPGAFGVVSHSVVRPLCGCELLTEAPVEQQLILVSLGDPTPAARTVIDVLRRLAAKNAGQS